MKRLILASFFLTSFLFSNAQDYVIGGKDTINMTDANGKKQGIWILHGYTKKNPCYKDMQVIEEGIYKDNKRVGVWKEYYCNRNLKSKISYLDGRPHGSATFYYENETIREEGTWINNRWTGNYKSIDDKGNVTEIVFDDKGKEISKKMTASKNSVPSKKK